MLLCLIMIIIFKEIIIKFVSIFVLLNFLLLMIIKIYTLFYLFLPPAEKFIFFLEGIQSEGFFKTQKFFLKRGKIRFQIFHYFQ